MPANATNPPPMGQATVTVTGDNFRLEARVPVPLGPTRAVDMLSLARGLADAVVRETCQTAEAQGAPVTCKAGCGACCRNLVMISEVEARRLGTVVRELPEPRRTEVLARFADARKRLDQAGLLTALERAEAWTAADYTRLVADYFGQGIACPFLEDESCSIYAERPITCREYLVVSPPEHCANLGSAGVQRVQLPVRVFNAVARWQTPPGKHLEERAVPLILAIEWAEAHAEEPPPRPGPELLRELLDGLKKANR